MPEPSTNWFFQPRSRGADAGDDSAPGSISLPADVLQRHGAQILDPETAVAVADYPTPRCTVYRTRTLLVPADLQQGPTIGVINKILADVGMKLNPGLADQGPGHGDARIARLLAEVPRPAVLSPVEGSRKPMAVDAWVALQTLRAAAALPRKPGQADADRAEPGGHPGPARTAARGGGAARIGAPGRARRLRGGR